MKEVWFIRHAESASNAGQSTSDSALIPLTENGKLQAETLASSIVKKPDLIIHSKFLRTFETATPTIFKYPSVPVEILPLHEFDFLAKDRCFNSTAEQRKPMVLDYWNKNDPDYVDGDGAESFNSFVSRVISSLNVIESKDEKFIVVFTHGHVIRAIWNYFLTPNQSLKMDQFKAFSAQFPVANTGIFKAQYYQNEWLL